MTREEPHREREICLSFLHLCCSISKGKRAAEAEEAAYCILPRALVWQQGSTSFPLAPWGGKPVPKKSAGGKEGSIFSTLANAPCPFVSATTTTSSSSMSGREVDCIWVRVDRTFITRGVVQGRRRQEDYQCGKRGHGL